jgi:hypothetical protein
MLSTQGGNAAMNPTKLSLQIAGTLLLPFIVMTVYLATWARNDSSDHGDWVALFLSISAGEAVLMTAPLRPWMKLFACFVYALAMVVALFLYGFAFVCGAYDRCL